ncbi:MAG: 50S ribosomal protein L6 [Candidatus Magasanikbacteria bacterium]|nr:50S ribosomal protein L6 [Candidatus Magasanikbacteria bacterium]
MSRIGKQIINIPQGTTAQLSGSILSIKGPKGELQRTIHEKVQIQVAGSDITVDVKEKEEKSERSLWGTFASHIMNMIEGVNKGFEKKLEINGVGYRASMQGTDLKIEVGFSHPVIFKIPSGIQAQIEKNIITVRGADKELLGDTVAKIRAIRKPEPYKGKGIKYVDEVIRRKAGKTAAKGE